MTNGIKIKDDNRTIFRRSLLKVIVLLGYAIGLRTSALKPKLIVAHSGSLHCLLWASFNWFELPGCFVIELARVITLDLVLRHLR